MTKPKPYGQPPYQIYNLKHLHLPEMMHYLYLPVIIGNELGYHHDPVLPPNIECLREMINYAICDGGYKYRYVYVTARKGWASPDNPLNRPGWHCDGFGSDDLNYIWWQGPGTRFAVQEFHDISEDHTKSAEQFEEQIKMHTGTGRIRNPLSGYLYRLNPFVVHATPIIQSPGCMREFVKVSFSNHRYNLEDNSHNYGLDYNWKMFPRNTLRNDPHKAGLDYVED